VADVLTPILDRLEGVRKQGSGYRARCPGHGSSGPTLSVKENEGRILIHCFAGCTPDEVRRALDLPWSAFFPEGSERTKRRTLNRRNVELEAIMLADRLQSEAEVLERFRLGRGWSAGAFRRLGVGWDGERLTLPTHDKDGKLNDVLRYDPFATRGPKMLAGFGRSRSLWPAPESVDTSYLSRFLFVVEGEGTALTMWSLGLPAVACPGSVAKPSGDVERPGKYEGVGWHKSWGARFGAHKRIVLIPDCDTPGRTLARAAHYDLTSEGASVTTLDLAPERDDGKDVGDWARPFVTAEQRRLARDLLVMLVDVAARHPEQLEGARALTVGFSRFEASGGEIEQPEAAPAPVSPPEPSGVPWDWKAAA